MTLSKDSIIGDILDYDSSCEQVFLEMGMHCTGCPASRGETVEEACDIHDVDVTNLLRQLTEHIQKKNR